MLDNGLRNSYNTLHLYINLALNITNNKAVSSKVILRWWLSSLARSLQIAILQAPHEISSNAAAGLGAVDMSPSQISKTNPIC